MASTNERFTAWLSATERKGIRERAIKEGTSDNYVVRTAIRQLLGLNADKNGPRKRVISTD